MEIFSGIISSLVAGIMISRFGFLRKWFSSLRRESITSLADELLYLIHRTVNSDVFQQAEELHQIAIADFFDGNNELNGSHLDSRFDKLAQRNFRFVKTFLIKKARSSNKEKLLHRQCAIVSLAGIANYRVVITPLATLLLDDPEPKIRIVTAHELAKLKSDFPHEVRDLLLTALKDKDLAVLDGVLGELEAFDDSTTLLGLCNLLKPDHHYPQKNHFFREKVMKAIDEITSNMLPVKDTNAIPAIENRLLKDESYKVLNWAIKILERIDGPPGEKALNNACTRFDPDGPFSHFSTLQPKISDALARIAKSEREQRP